MLVPLLRHKDRFFVFDNIIYWISHLRHVPLLRNLGANLIVAVKMVIFNVRKQHFSVYFTFGQVFMKNYS